MKENVYYCKGWFTYKKKPVEPLTIKEARALHEAGAEHVALIGDPVRPKAYLELILARNFVRCSFLDVHLRQKLYCTFTGEPGTALLLTQSLTRRFNADTNEVEFAWSFKLDPNGDLVLLDKWSVSAEAR